MHLPSAAERILATARPYREELSMDEMTRRKLKMGRRALDFCRAHPDSSPEYITTVARLEALLARAELLKLQEKNQRKQSGSPRGLTGKVIPFVKRSKGDPSDPAA
jgi:hypothetical protein